MATHRCHVLAAILATPVLVSELASEARAQTCNLHVLGDFDSTTGFSPMAGVIQGSDGQLYGATSFGGASGWGTVYSVATDGSGYKILHDFDVSTGNHVNSLIQASDGMLYGTTLFGGQYGSGMVFRLDTDGSNYSDIHDLYPTSDGSEPGPLLEGSDGALYGAAASGGLYGWGTVFKLDTDGSGFADLHDFDLGIGNGINPTGGLIQLTTDGMLYGTTRAGGYWGGGVLYSLNLDGTGFNLVHAFLTYDNPSGGVTQIPGLAKVCGVTSGTPYSQPQLFTCDTYGIYTDLFDFDSGSAPLGPLVISADGSMFGTTQTGGTGGGTLFTWSPLGHFLTLIEFTSAIGTGPTEVIIGSDGNLFGTTSSGGPYTWDGMLYSYTAVAAAANLYGSGLAGTNGIPSIGLTTPNHPGVDRPVLGEEIELDVGNSLGGNTLAVLCGGWRQATIPLFGGTLLVELAFVFPFQIPPAGAALDSTVADEPCLCGEEVDLQVLEVDPGAPRFVSFTRGLQLIVGLDL